MGQLAQVHARERFGIEKWPKHPTPYETEKVEEQRMSKPKTEAANASPWIKIAPETLPELGTVVLVIRYGFVEDIHVEDISKYAKGATHWMPLPPLPGSEE